MGIEFWAEPGDRHRALRVFTSGEGLPGGYLELPGEARTGHGLVWYLYQVAEGVNQAGHPRVSPRDN